MFRGCSEVSNEISLCGAIFHYQSLGFLLVSAYLGGVLEGVLLWKKKKKDSRFGVTGGQSSPCVTIQVCCLPLPLGFLGGGSTETSLWRHRLPKQALGTVRECLRPSKSRSLSTTLGNRRNGCQGDGWWVMGDGCWVMGVGWWVPWWNVPACYVLRVACQGDGCHGATVPGHSAFSSPRLVWWTVPSHTAILNLIQNLILSPGLLSLRITKHRHECIRCEKVAYLLSWCRRMSGCYV